MSQNIFVFVVCGKREHVDTLQYSLRALQRFSKNEIIVVTDSSRNEVTVVHENQIDISTPKELNHHQASIYLKTGLHKFLPEGNNYCYLDTDVVAVNDSVDSIFEQFVAPITFAPDHCVMNQFSPSAVNCNCEKEYGEWEAELKQLFIEHKDLIRVPENLEKKKKLLYRLAETKKNKWTYRWLSLRFNLACKIFKLDEDTFLNKQEHYWHDKNGQPILYEKDVISSVEIIESKTSFRCDRNDYTLWTINGKNVFDCRCNHLQQQIKETFGIEISNALWQHWNGGVFLFNNSSHIFLNSWHEKTRRIFSLPEWKTRDQGTLIATAWENNLHNHLALPHRFNLIADYGHKNIEHNGELRFTIKNIAEEIKPCFVHVYHHWADENWDVWQAIEKIHGLPFANFAT